MWGRYDEAGGKKTGLDVMVQAAGGGFSLDVLGSHTNQKNLHFSFAASARNKLSFPKDTSRNSISALLFSAVHLCIP